MYLLICVFGLYSVCLPFISRLGVKYTLPEVQSCYIYGVIKVKGALELLPDLYSTKKKS